MLRHCLSPSLVACWPVGDGSARGRESGDGVSLGGRLFLFLFSFFCGMGRICLFVGLGRGFLGDALSGW